tara:strand:+ start:1185 stop:1430 length:246 start_codon:yes stop_codon:yes gene_type:complete
MSKEFIVEVTEAYTRTYKVEAINQQQAKDEAELQFVKDWLGDKEGIDYTLWDFTTTSEIKPTGSEFDACLKALELEEKANG